LIFRIILAIVAFSLSGGGAEEARAADKDGLAVLDKSYALVIGAGDYNNGWQRLPHAVGDAESVAEALQRRGFVVDTVFNPTGAVLRNILEKGVNRTGNAADRLIIYFAGHGETVSEQDKDDGEELGYIVPVDAPKPARDMIGFLDRAVSMRSIVDAAGNADFRHVLLLFDCCFSGAILSGGGNEAAINGGNPAQPALQFITAGGRDEEVPDRSIFTYCLLQALDGDADLNGDGCMTASELSVYLHDNVVRRSRDTLHPLYGRIGDPHDNRSELTFRPEPLIPSTHKQITDDPKSGYISTDLTVYRVDSGFEPRIPDIEFTYIPAGSFQIGSPYSEAGRDDDEGPQQSIRIRAFRMQTTELTQLQWKQVMGYNPSFFKGDSLPVEQVSWNQVQEFIGRLNAIDPGKGYRLPSEAEWEYACRAGSSTRFPWGDDPHYYALGMFSWTDVGTTGDTHPVGRKLPNAWGLYDMHGNVFEWCRDWYHDSYDKTPTDGSALESPVGSQRVYRGGGSVIPSWEYDARRCRSAYRCRGRPTSRYYDVGFRLVKNPRQPSG